MTTDENNAEGIVARFGNNIAANAPILPFMGLALWLTWANLFTGPPLWFIAGFGVSAPLSDLFRVSRTLLVIIALAAALMHKRVAHLFSSRKVVLAGGAIVCIGTLVAIVGTGINSYYNSQLTMLIPLSGAALTGIGTTVFMLRCGELFSRITPWHILLYSLISRLLMGALYFIARGIPVIAPTMFPWFNLAGTIFLLLLPLAASFLMILPVQKQVTGESSEDAPTTDFSKYDERALIRMGIAFFAFALIESMARATSPSSGGFGFAQDSDIVTLLVMLVCLGFAMAISGHSSLKMNRMYLLYTALVIIVVGTVALAPIAGIGNISWGSVISFFAKIVSLFLWCILAVVARRRNASSVLVFGYGFAMFSLGEIVGLVFGGGNVLISLPYDMQMIVCISAASIALMINFLLFSERDLKGLMMGEEAAMAPLSGIFEKRPQAKVKTQEKMPRRFDVVVDRIAEEYSLSPREKEIMRLLAMGYTKNAISERLGISDNTIRTHSRNVYTKLNVHSRQELMDLIDIAQ